MLARSVTRAGHGGGFDPNGVVTLRLRPLLGDYSPRQGQAFSREAIRRLEGLPGVRSVSLGVVLPPWLPGEPVAVSLEVHGSGSVAALAADLGEIEGVHTVAAGDVNEIFD